MSSGDSKHAFTNDLSDAEDERLALLLEELGEAQQAIGKILRHGYESYDAEKLGAENGPNNRAALERELGDVRYAVMLMCQSGDLSDERIADRAIRKAGKIGRYLHHQKLGEHYE